MALTKCAECGKEVSDSAGKCPHCGAKVKKPAGPLAWLLSGVVLLAILMGAVGKPGSRSNQTQDQPQNIETPAERAVRLAHLKDDLAHNKAGLLARLKSLQAQGKHDEVIGIIGTYDGVTDPDLDTLAKISRAAIAKIEREKSVIKEKLSKMGEASLCVETGKALRTNAKRNKLRDEVLLALAAEKYDVAAADYSAIQSRSPRIGMQWCSLIAAKGQPERINRTINTHGEHQQWVFGDIGDHAYVYLDNGKVTSWQE